MSPYGYIIAIVFVIVYYFLFEYVMLDSKIKQREKKINNEAIYFFEVLTLSLQTGRNLAEAIEITVNSVDGDLSLEFKEAMRENLNEPVVAFGNVDEIYFYTGSKGYKKVLELNPNNKFFFIIHLYIQILKRLIGS